MLTYAMSADEVRKEIKGDCFYLEGIINGKERLMERKMRENWKGERTGNLVLDVTKYKTPTRKNNVWLASAAIYMGSVARITYAKFFEVLTKEGTVQLIMACDDGQNIVFTAHALSRIFERTGMTMLDTLQLIACLGAFLIVPYVYKGEEQMVFALGNKGLFFCEETEMGWVCKTFVSDNLLVEDQKNASAFSFVSCEEIMRDESLEIAQKQLERKGYSLEEKQIA